MTNLGPSEELLRDAQVRLLRRLAERTTVTLMGHCTEDEPHCRRDILQAILWRKKWGTDSAKTPSC